MAKHMLKGDAVPYIAGRIVSMASIVVGPENEDDVVVSIFRGEKVVKYILYVHPDDFKKTKKRFKEMKLAVSKWSSRYNFYAILELEE